MLIVFLQLLIFSSLPDVKGAKILAVFPTPSMSPQPMLRTLLEELSGRSHEITLVTANQEFTTEEVTKNITTVNFQNEMSKIWQKYVRIISSEQYLDVVSETSLTLNTATAIFKELLKTDEMKELMEKKQSYFDILLLEASLTPLLSLSRIFEAHVILVSSTGALFGNYEIVGAPTHPFLYPSIFQRRIYNLTTWEKVTELYTYMRLRLTVESYEKKLDFMLKKHFGPDFPSVNRLKENVYALFLNSDALWSEYHPVSPNVIFMGGIQPKTAEKLTQDLQSFLDHSKNGVIYVSFGSMIKPSLLPPEKLLRILNVLSEIPYDVLIKWDNDKLPGTPKNIKVYKWLPQASLLGHSKIKLFITQGGTQSTFEAINGGVPLIGIPLSSDQWYNTEKYVKFHIGLQIELASLDEEKLIDAIDKVISDGSYRDAILELRDLMSHTKATSMDRAIWWIEQLLRPYGLQHLRAPAANITWAQYLELDLLFFIFLAMSVTILIFIVFLTLILRYILKSYDDMKKKIS